MKTPRAHIGAGLAVAMLLSGVACSKHHSRSAAAAAAPTTTATSAPQGDGSESTTAPSARAAGAGGNSATSPAGSGTVSAATSTRPGGAGAPGANTVALKAKLAGEAEVSNGGIPGAAGLATVKITGMQMCYTLNIPIAEKPIIANIYEGAAGQTGDIVINLEVVFDKTGSAFVAEKCLDKDPQLLGGIIADPAGFYVNVFTSEHPRGALRGQLAVS